MFTIITGDDWAECDTLENAKHKAFYDALYLQKTARIFDDGGREVYSIEARPSECDAGG